MTGSSGNASEPWWKKTIAGGVTVANLLQGVTAILTLFCFVFGVTKCSDLGNSQVAPTASTSERVTQNSREASVSSAPARSPDCWDSGRNPVSCNDDHQFEVIGSADDCTRNAILSFLGADALDVPVFDEDKTLKPGACVVNATATRRPPFRDALLAADNGAAWRSCLVGQFAAPATYRPVSCDLPHQGEYLSTTASTSDSDEGCVGFAATYMGRTTIGDLAKELTVVRIPGAEAGAGRARCAIWSTSGPDLHGTLRRLGSRELPR